MKLVLRWCGTVGLAFFLAACGGGDDSSSSGSGSNSNIQLPASVSGEVITYTVTNSGTAGIPVGYKIEWTFSGAGVIKGRNPVSGQIVTPNRYSYVMNGKTGAIDVRYVQGNQTAYEVYTMTATTTRTGSYTYSGDTGTGVKTAAGTYEIR